MIALGVKEAFEPQFRYVGADRARIPSFARYCKGAFVHIGREDDEVTLDTAPFEFFMEKNRK